MGKRADKKGFMRELKRLGFSVGNFETSSDHFYEAGGFDISAEFDPDRKAGVEFFGEPEAAMIQMFFDYYGEFRGGYPYITPKMEDLAADYGYYFEWYNAAIVCATPDY